MRDYARAFGRLLDAIKWSLLASIALISTAADIDGATATIFAGGGSKTTGPAVECRLADPFAIDFDSSGTAYICEMTNNRVIKVDAKGQLTQFAGTTRKGATGDGGPAREATLNSPHHLLVDRAGGLLIADSFNSKIRRIDLKTETITTFAGGTRGFSGDGGPMDQAQYTGIYCLALDPAGENLYLADLENRRVRAINLKTKIVRTAAGNGQRGIPPDGSEAASSPLVDPRAVAVAKDGSLYILERSGNALRVVDRSGRIRTVVGSGKAGPLTDATSPLQVTLRGPKHLCTDAESNVLIADSDNDAIRKYLPHENKVVLVAGTGKVGAQFDQNPSKTELNHPHGVNVDQHGVIYVCDSYNGRVIRIK